MPNSNPSIFKENNNLIVINDRIVLLIESLGISTNKFSIEIGVSPPVIHNIIKARRSKPSFEILEKILLTYKEVSVDWLLRGNGKVWSKQSQLLAKNRATSNELEGSILKLIDTMRNDEQITDEAFQLSDLVELLIDKNREQKRKMVKLHERQEEIIRTLKRLKVKL